MSSEINCDSVAQHEIIHNSPLGEKSDHLSAGDHCGEIRMYRYHLRFYTGLISR